MSSRRCRTPQCAGSSKTVSADYLASRSRDAAGSSQTAFKYAVAFWDDVLPEYVNEITDADVQSAISGCELSPSSLRAYLSTLRQVFDFAKVEPNPARAKLRLPKVDEEVINPPDADHVEAILSRVSKRLKLPLIAAEQCALRVSEVQSLEWGDVDEAGCRFRLRREATKRGKSRFVPVPERLMTVIAETCPREDRTPTRRVFTGFNDDTARGAMTQGCKTAGLALMPAAIMKAA